MNIILLTGPIASGKSQFVRRASEWFYAHNQPVKIIALDSYGHEVLNDREVMNCLVASFGSDLIVGGVIDVKLLALRAFSSRDSVEQLNRCTHPRISERARRDIDAFLAECPEGIVLLETPFPRSYLREHGFLSLIKHSLTVVVNAPKETRMSRCVGRITDSQKRDEIQQGYGAYEGDVVMINNFDEESFNKQVDAFCRSLKEKL